MTHHLAFCSSNNDQTECVQPKFLTKEDRAAEAIKRRQEQVDAQRRVLDEERKKQDEFMKAAKESAGQNISCYNHLSATHFQSFLY